MAVWLGAAGFEAGWLELLPTLAFGFLGSFGHCASMCGPLVLAFSLSDVPDVSDSPDSPAKSIDLTGGRPRPDSKRSRWAFQLWLNLGRMLGYGLVGAMLGGVGEVAIAGGQLAGIGSGLRQGVAIATGLLLIWFGVMQAAPGFLPAIPLLQPLTAGLHGRLSGWMSRLAGSRRVGTPIVLGGLWGMMPCGFLFAAQLEAVGTGSALGGLLAMLAFGLGTLPVMLGIGMSASWLNADRRGQLFRAAGVVAIAIGLLTVLRTDAMFDWTGHGALLMLAWALVARPIARWWPQPLRYRRAIGVAAFVLALAHLGHQADHALNWNPGAIRFMLPSHRYGLMAGIAAMVCMTPAALTSFDRLQAALGSAWRRIHLLTVPALGLAVGHTVFSGSNYLGELARTGSHYGRSALVVAIALGVFALRGGAIARAARPAAPPEPAQTCEAVSSDCCNRAAEARSKTGENSPR